MYLLAIYSDVMTIHLRKGYAEMSETNKPPLFLSMEFHTSFFPALLWRLLHPKKRKYESTFAGHIRLELPVMAIASIVLGVYGFSAAIGSGSIIGWVCGTAGLGVFSYLLINSIRSVRGMRPSFDYFRTIIFLFFVFLGLTIGLEMGNAYRVSYGFKLIFGIAGLSLGYISGILGGFWVQCLGWMASLLDVIALVAISGMVILDIVLLM
jgi:hypothetical protein